MISYLCLLAVIGLLLLWLWWPEHPTVDEVGAASEAAHKEALAEEELKDLPEGVRITIDEHKD